MSDIKRYDIGHSDRSGSYKDEEPDGEYVEWEDHASAISAKDSKIAELEELVDRCIITLDAYDIEATALDDARLYVTAQHQPDPATHSEDGREVPEVVAWIRGSGLEMLRSGDGIATVFRSEHASNHSTPLMTFAQHERIVAAKDAEISRLSSDLSYFPPTVRALAETISELPAQPARQVGDERDVFEAWMHTFDLPPQLEGEVFDDENYMDADCFGQFVYEDHSTQRCWAAWQARAALAPAAVDEIARVKNAAREIRDHLKKEVARLESDLEHARKKVLVVMPEKKESRQFDPAGWNAALDEVARLNRRAIPVGLLERVCTWPETFDDRDRRDAAIDELRALLGKS